jgi:tetratricopeptide (TPR) repeat protein
MLQDAGSFEAAIRWYSSFAHVSMYDLVLLAPSHLRRAEIYERLGERDAARRHYARFIELWANCDPELRSQVDRAEQRLAELQG